MDEKSVSYTLDANVFLSIAYDAMLKAKTNPATEPEQSLIAVLMSCVAVEAYINETGQLVNQMPQISDGIDRLEKFGKVLSDIEEDHGQTRLKYRMAYFILTGKRLEKSIVLYNDFLLLFRVRDELMHYKLKVYKGYGEADIDVLKKLRNKKLCREGMPSFLSQISTPELASWAYDVAYGMILLIRKALQQIANEHTDIPMLQTLVSFNGFNPEQPTSLQSSPNAKSKPPAETPTPVATLH